MKSVNRDLFTLKPQPVTFSDFMSYRFIILFETEDTGLFYCFVDK